MEKRDYSFSGQKENEKVLLYVRRHWVTFIGPFLLTLTVFLLPLITAIVVLTGSNIFEIPSDLIWISALVWVLLGGFFMIYNFLDWYLDIYIVTNMRIIDINQNGLFHRVVGETPLDNVQDVVYEVKGIIATIFNYGSVTVHTGGPTGDICFEQVEKPQQVQRFLLAEAESYKNVNTEKIASPEDLLNMMMNREKQKLTTLGTPDGIYGTIDEKKTPKLPEKIISNS